MDKTQNLIKYSLMALLMASIGLVLGCSSTGENAEVADRECRSTEELGSRIQKRHCMSKEQWLAFDERYARIMAANEKNTQEAMQNATMIGGLSAQSTGGYLNQ